MLYQTRKQIAERITCVEATPNKGATFILPRRLCRSIVACLFLSLLSACHVPESQLDVDASNPSDVVSPVVTASGVVQGGIAGRTRFFFGIPYAAPPVNDLRWAPPLPHPGWSVMRKAEAMGPICPQILDASDTNAPEMSEDCLNLNVWTPWPPPAKAPVMVFIHGGGFVQGYSASPYYDGRAIAEQSGAVVVTFNYRLGVLGFLAHPAMTVGAGEYGFLDQQAALRWIQQNIAAFGGDPQNVTIWGESAGGISVCMHLVAPESWGLFHRAISESGPCPWFLPTLTEAYAQGEELAQKVGCVQAEPFEREACLRGVPSDTLINALPLLSGRIFGDGFWWFPVVDGHTLPAQPLSLLEQGQFNRVPVIFGTNQNEGSVFTAGNLVTNGSLNPSIVLTDEEYRTIILEIFSPEDSASIYQQYDPMKYSDQVNTNELGSLSAPARALSDLLGDWYFVCPSRRSMRAIGQDEASLSFLYRFSWRPSHGAFGLLGSFHGAEVPFVFNNLTDDLPNIAYSDADESLSRVMLELWSQFALAGNPNSSASIVWPAYNPLEESYLILNLQRSWNQSLEREQCDFWDALGTYQGN